MSLGSVIGGILLAATARAAEPGFREACEQRATLSAAARATVRFVLDKVAPGGDCEAGAKALASAEFLDLSGGFLKDLTPLGALPELRRIDLSSNDISDLAALQRAPKLEETYLNHCCSAVIPATDAALLKSNVLSGKLAFINGVASASKATELDVDCEGAPLAWRSLAHFPPLRSLRTTGCAGFDAATVSGLTSLVALEVNDGRFDLGALPALPQLRSFHALGTALTGAPDLRGVPLVRFSVEAGGLADVGFLASAPALRQAELVDEKAAWQLAALAGARTLRLLRVNGASLAGVDKLAALTELRFLSLNFGGGGPVPDLTPLTALKNLAVLRLTGAVGDTAFLAKMPQLLTLLLVGAKTVDLKAVAALRSLQLLLVSGAGLTDLTPLAGLKSLRELDIPDNAVVDLTPLAKLANLRIADLQRNKVSDYTPLKALRWLHQLSVAGNAGTLAACPVANVRDCFFE